MSTAARHADLVIVGRIATLREPRGFGWVGAIAISGGRVLAAGARSDVEALVGRGTRTWRLAPDLLVMPGITDAHLHLVSQAMAADQLDLTGLDLAGVVRMVRDEHHRRVVAGDRTEAILGHGWSLDALGKRPDATDLDGAAPDRVIALWAHDHHTRWVSSECLRRAGLDASRTGADPPGGQIDRDDHGAPSGLLLEHAAVLVDPTIPQPRADTLERALLATMAGLAALGVTTAHDPGEVSPDPELRRGPVVYRTLARSGRLLMRIVASVREEQLDAGIALGVRTGRGLLDAPVGHYRDGYLKLFADGSLGSRSAALLEPYEAEDPAGPPSGGATGMMLRTPEALRDSARRAADAGIATQIHAIGDAAVRVALDVLADVPRIGDVNHRIEHAQLVHRQDLPRFAQLGVAASVQACHLLSDAGPARDAWGSRTTTAFPLSSLARSGALMPLGTDAPVEPMDPWRGIAAAVTRRGAEWPEVEAFHIAERIDLARALRAACLDGPRSLGIQDEGHLGAGARADLVIIPSDVLRAPDDPAVIGGCRPQATLIDGEPVHVAMDLPV